jgi:hypothetical protein
MPRRSWFVRKQKIILKVPKPLLRSGSLYSKENRKGKGAKEIMRNNQRRAYDKNEIDGDAGDKTPYHVGRNELGYDPQIGSGCL